MQRRRCALLRRADRLEPARCRLRPWVRAHVIPATRWLRRPNPNPFDDRGTPQRGVLGDQAAVAAALADWLGQWPRIEVWGDCPAYDWVLFCELFGGARRLPAAIDYIPRDLATLLALRGLDPDLDRDRFGGIDRPPGQGHNALWDARAVRACCRRLLGPNPR